MSGQLPRMGLPEEDVEMIEIPRFKKRELNLGIVRKHPGKQRAAWLALGGLWVVNGLLSLVSVNPGVLSPFCARRSVKMAKVDVIIYPQFFDMNVIYILVQQVESSFITIGRDLIEL